MIHVNPSPEMHYRQTSLAVRCTALIAVLAWFVASNHCAFSALVERVAKGAAPAAECKNCPSKGGGEGKSGGMSGCCKGIKATPSTPGLADFDAGLFGKLVQAVELLLPPPRTEGAVPGIAGTGPPRSLCFAEAVLSRSFQSHAPPFVG